MPYVIHYRTEDGNSGVAPIVLTAEQCLLVHLLRDEIGFAAHIDIIEVDMRAGDAMNRHHKQLERSGAGQPT